MKKYFILLLSLLAFPVNAQSLNLYSGVMAGITHMHAKGSLELNTYSPHDSSRNAFNYNYYRNKLSPHFLIGANHYINNFFYGLEANASPFDNLSSSFVHHNGFVAKPSLTIKESYGVALRAGYRFERDKIVYLKIFNEYRLFEQRVFRKELVNNNNYVNENYRKQREHLWGIGGGLEKRLNNTWNLRAEYKVTPFKLRNYEVDQKISHPFREKFSTKAKGYIHSFLVGFSYNFTA
jgi:opacity protein-like surface antigen